MGCKSRNHWSIPYCVRKAYCVGKCRTCLNFKNYKAAEETVIYMCNSGKSDCDFEKQMRKLRKGMNKAWVTDGPIITTSRTSTKKAKKETK